MKRILTTILIALICLPAIQAKDKEVILTMQIAPYQRNKIPAKTDELKLKTLRWQEQAHYATFINALKPLLERIATEDLDHITYTLNIDYLPDGDGTNDLMVTITGFDLMNETAAARAEIMGAMQVGYRYFIVKPTVQNKSLLQHLFTTEKTKIKFVREFELVAHPVDLLNTQVNADWQQGELQLRRCVIADENKLNEDENL